MQTRPAAANRAEHTSELQALGGALALFKPNQASTHIEREKASDARQRYLCDAGVGDMVEAKRLLGAPQRYLESVVCSATAKLVMFAIAHHSLDLHEYTHTRVYACV